MSTYRRTKQGTWVVFGPASEVKPGPVTVTKKDGTTKVETVTGVGKPFQVNGVPHVYGYTAPRRQQSRSSDLCDECGENRARYNAVDMSGISGRVCGVCYNSGGLSFA